MGVMAMTSKQRVRTTLAGGAADRVPINYSANPGIDRRLKEHFGLEPNDGEGLRQALGVDFRGIGAPYTGPKLHEDIPERGVKADIWGIRRMYIEHESGGYWDYCDFPLKDADEQMIADWPMPSPDDHDYAQIAAACARHRDRALHIGGPGLGCIINTAGFFRTMEQVFLDLALDDPAGLLLIDRFLGIQLEVAERTLAAAPKGAIDFVWMGEDLGTQQGPIIGMDMFVKHILPRHKPFFDLAAAHDLPVMLHTCGSSSWSYEQYIKIGLKAVDTLLTGSGGHVAGASQEDLRRAAGVSRLHQHGRPRGLRLGG
jgi:uroporphyrinogen decarboxylase